MDINIQVTNNPDIIKAELKILRKLTDERLFEIKQLRLAIESYQKMCDHKGQKTGYNYRDGDWANPCPTCGYSY